MKTIVLTGGGTGGHVTPHIALFDYLKDKYKIHYIGSDGIEKEIMQGYDFVTFHTIPSVKFIRKITAKNLAIPFVLHKAKKQALAILKEIKPNVIFSKGGYVSIPVVLASAKLGLPIISHESDLSMGLANKIIYRKCNCMCTSFEETAKGHNKCVFTGPPIRKALLQGSKELGYKTTKLDRTKKTILFIGGSTGAQAINNLIESNIKVLTRYYNIIHITGKNKSPNITAKSYYKVEYTNTLENLLAISDIVVSRAGSNVINELLAIKKPMLLIPLPKKSSRGDQVQNAELFQKKGYAMVLYQEAMTIDILLDKIKQLLSRQNEYIGNMSNSANLDSNQKICNIIDKYCL